MHKHVTVNDFKIGNDLPLTIIAGPCQMETRDHTMMMAETLTKICEKHGLKLIYKTSFDKANRTSISGKRGIGMEKALPIFEEVKKTFGCPVITDVHLPEHCEQVAGVIDVLQIPAFLCRQTDLLLAAAKTGLAINVKKGQFLAPWDMENVAKKLEAGGNDQIMLCERGTTFGYNRLVVDMRSFPIMAKTGYPVVFDATHSVQEPGGQGASTGGKREYAPILARAAVSMGIAAVFMETHQDPDNAPSDGPNMIYLKDMDRVIGDLAQMDKYAKENPLSL
jgi:2-dehydro-3-deoxyphosphooctonate aldolase (KDO 8-P synthase)